MCFVEPPRRAPAWCTPPTNPTGRPLIIFAHHEPRDALRKRPFSGTGPLRNILGCVSPETPLSCLLTEETFLAPFPAVHRLEKCKPQTICSTCATLVQLPKPSPSKCRPDPHDPRDSPACESNRPGSSQERSKPNSAGGAVRQRIWVMVGRAIRNLSNYHIPKRRGATGERSVGPQPGKLVAIGEGCGPPIKLLWAPTKTTIKQTVSEDSEARGPVLEGNPK